MAFPPEYSVSYRAAAKAFSRAFARMPALEAESPQRIDTERWEDIYRGPVPGITRGDPPAGATAIKALEHKARINGYGAVQEIGLGSSSFSIHIHLSGDTPEPKPAIDLRRTRTIGPRSSDAMSLVRSLHPKCSRTIPPRFGGNGFATMLAPTIQPKTVRTLRQKRHPVTQERTTQACLRNGRYQLEFYNRVNSQADPISEL